MTDVRTFTPVFSEPEARIRTRMDADANAGLTSDDPLWIDTREGSFYWDVTQAALLEIARLWESLATETVAAAFPSTAWGDYLDEHAATFGLTRNPAVPATGIVLFAGQAGTLVGQNVQVSAPPSDPAADAVEFVTTESGTTSAALTPPTGLAAVLDAGAGSLAANTYHWRVTAYSAFGETLVSADATLTLVSNAGLVTISWAAVPGAAGYYIYRTLTAADDAQRVGQVTAVYKPTGLAVVQLNTSGSLAANTYYYAVTSVGAEGETTATATVSLASALNATNKLTWNADLNALSYNIYRGTSAGALHLIGNVLNPGTGTVTFNDAGTATPGAAPPSTDTTTRFDDAGTATPGVYQPSADTSSGVFLPIQALVPGSSGDLSANAITDLDTSVPGISLVTNQTATSGGTDREDDAALRARVLGMYVGQGAGTISDYETWALSVPGVERAFCVPVYAGAGTVLVVPMLKDGSAVAAPVVTVLQNQLDPVAGQGAGQAPIGAAVTVETTTPLTVNIAATIVHDTGYSLDGTSGTIATRSGIQAALAAYLTAMNPGQVIRFQQVQAAILSVEGVIGVTGLQVNSGTADITLGVSPPHNAALATPALS